MNFAFPHLNSVKADVLVNLAQEKNNQSDFIGTVQNSGNFSIHANSMTYLKCKMKSDNIGTKSLHAIFLPKLDLDTDLIMTENLVRINAKRTITIKIPVCNRIKDLKSRRKTRIGQLELISSAVPLEIKQSKLPEMNEIKICKDSPKWLPNVDLDYLPEDQGVSVQKLSIEERETFSKSDNDNDIENIKSLKLKLNVTDPVPVCKPYRKIPKQIYSEVKEYIEDFFY